MKVDLVLRATCKLFPFANLVTEMYDQMLQKSGSERHNRLK